MTNGSAKSAYFGVHANYEQRCDKLNCETAGATWPDDGFHFDYKLGKSKGSLTISPLNKYHSYIKTAADDVRNAMAKLEKTATETE